MQVGLQTIANMLVTEAERCNKPPSAMIITTLAREELLPTLKGVIQGQAEAQSDAGDVKARVRAALKRITISRVFDYDGLRESLDELYLPGEHPLTASTSSPTTPDTAHNVAMGATAGDPVACSNQGLSQALKIDSVSHQGLERQQAVIDEEEQDDGLQQPKPDIILISNMPALLVSLYSSRHEDSAETALRNLRRRLRYITRSIAHRGPLVMLLGSAEAVVSYPDEEQFPEMEEADTEGRQAGEAETGNQTSEAGLSENEDDEPGDGKGEPRGEDDQDEVAQTVYDAAHARDLPVVPRPAPQDEHPARSPGAKVSSTEPPVPSDSISPFIPPLQFPTAQGWLSPPRRTPSPPSWSPLSAAGSSLDAELPPASPPSPSPISRHILLDLPPLQDKPSHSAPAAPLMSYPPPSSPAASPRPLDATASESPEETLTPRLLKNLGNSAAEIPSTSDPDDTDRLQDVNTGILDASHIPQPGFEPRLTSILQRPPYPPRNIEFTVDGSCIVRPEKASDMLQIWSKPFYGLEFDELLDLHLLCFQLPKDAQTEVGGQEGVGFNEADDVTDKDTEGDLDDDSETCRDEKYTTDVEDPITRMQDCMIDAVKEETHRVDQESGDVDLAGSEAMLAKSDADLRDVAANEIPVRRDDLVWMVEVLHDKYGVWDEDKDTWVTRDERWCALDVEKVDTGAIRLVYAYSEDDIIESMSDRSAGLARPYQEDHGDLGESPGDETGGGSSDYWGHGSEEDEPAEPGDRNMGWYHGEEPEQSGRDWDNGDAGEVEQSDDDVRCHGDTDVEAQLKYDNAVAEGHGWDTFSDGDEESIGKVGTTSQRSNEEGFAYQGFCIPGFVPKGPQGIRIPPHLLEVDTKTHAPWAPDPDRFPAGLLIHNTQRLWEIAVCGPNLKAASWDVLTDDDSGEEGATEHEPEDVLWQGYQEYMQVMDGHHRMGHVLTYEEFVAEAIACRPEEYDLAGSPELLDCSDDKYFADGREDNIHGDYEEADVDVQSRAFDDETTFMGHSRPMARATSSMGGTVCQSEGFHSESHEAVPERVSMPEKPPEGIQAGTDNPRIPDLAEGGSDSELSDVEVSDEDMELIEIKRSAAKYQKRQQAPELAGDEAETVYPVEVSEQEWHKRVSLFLKVVDGDYAAGYPVVTDVLRLVNGEDEGISDKDSPEPMRRAEDKELKAHWEKYLSFMDHARYTPDAMTYEQYLRVIHILVDESDRLSVEDAAFHVDNSHNGHQPEEDEYLLHNGAQYEDDLGQGEDTDDNWITLAAEYTAYMILMEEVGRVNEAMSYREFYEDICGHSVSRARFPSNYAEARPTEDPVDHDETILDKWQDAWADYFVRMDQAGLAVEAMDLDEYIAQATASMEDVEGYVHEDQSTSPAKGTLYSAWVDYVNIMAEEGLQDEIVSYEEYLADITHSSAPISHPSEHQNSCHSGSNTDPEVGYWGHDVPFLEGDEFDYWVSRHGDPETAYEEELDEACYELGSGVDQEQECDRHMAGWEGPVHTEEIAEWRRYQNCLEDAVLLVADIEAEETVETPVVVASGHEGIDPAHIVKRELETMTDSDSELSDMEMSDEEMELFEIDRSAAEYHRQHKVVMDSEDEAEDDTIPQ